jgi:hypothetical protein
MTTFRIVLEGTTLAGFDPESVRPQLAALIKSTEEAAGRLLSGKSSTVKSGVDQATALRYTEALRAIGVDCRIESEASVVHVEDDDAPQRTRGQQIVDMFMVDAGDSKRHRSLWTMCFRVNGEATCGPDSRSFWVRPILWLAIYSTAIPER